MNEHECKRQYGQAIKLIRLGLGLTTRRELADMYSLPVEILMRLEIGDTVQDKDWTQFYKEIREEVTLTQEERDCLDGDIFAYIPDTVANYIADICGRLGMDRCTCSELSDIVRKKNGHPLYCDLKRIKELEGKLNTL